MSFQMQIHELLEDRKGTAEFESVDDALAWIAQRPQFVRVLGPAPDMKLDAEDEKKLRDAMRPLDAEEARRLDELDATREKRRVEELAGLQRQATGESRATTPGLLDIVWQRGRGMRHADERNTSEIPATVRDAVLAWLRERDAWVHPRRQHLAGARVQVDAATAEVAPGGEFEAAPGFADDEIA